MIDIVRLEKLKGLIEQGKADEFYTWEQWRKKRLEVLALDNYECQNCKRKGKYSKATIVHHIKHVKDRPDLAMSIWDGEERQLVCLCKKCHEDEHPESFAQYTMREKAEEELTAERWD